MVVEDIMWTFIWNNCDSGKDGIFSFFFFFPFYLFWWRLWFSSAEPQRTVLVEPECNPISSHYRPARETFLWRADSGPLLHTYWDGLWGTVLWNLKYFNWFMSSRHFPQLFVNYYLLPFLVKAGPPKRSKYLDYCAGTFDILYGVQKRYVTDDKVFE